MDTIFNALDAIQSRPQPFEIYSASDLWTDEYVSKQMLTFHLNGDVDLSSRNARFIRQSVDWIASHFGPAEKLHVVDFGCGPGLYTTPLAQKGAQVTGIDFSRRSIAYATEVAQKNKLSIRYVHQNYLEFDTPERFDLIIMIMCDFCVLSPTERATMLNKFHDLLRPGGRVLLDIYTLSAFARRQESAGYEVSLRDGFWSADKYYCFMNAFKYEEQKVTLDKYTIIESARVRTIYNWLQYFSPEAIAEEFSSAGLKVQELYADVAGTPFDPHLDEFAVVAGLLP